MRTPNPLTLAAAALALAMPAAGQPLIFNEVAAEVGVQFVQDSQDMVPFGGGAAWADFNEDGLQDLFVAQGGETECNRLYRNAGDGTFGEVVDALGAGACSSESLGVAVADYDNDGDQDLYVTTYGQNLLFRNEFVESGSVSFTDVTGPAGMLGDGEDNSASASWGDYDGDGWLDLAVVNHALYVPIDDQSCQPDLLYHNEGDGTFTEVGADLGIALSGVTGLPGCGLAVTWSDFDNDRDLDLWVVNDFGEVNVQNKLFRNDGAGGPNGWIFTDRSRQAAVDYPMFGMGIAKSDINGDSYLDYYMSDIGPNNLALSAGEGTFAEVAAVTRTMASDKPIYGGSGLVSWGNVFVDLTGDGNEELLVVNGGAPESKWPGMFGPDYEDFNPVYAYANRGRLDFFEGHEAIGMTATGFLRTVAMADFDNDGDIDFHIGALEGNNLLYRNDSAQSFNWLQVKAVGTTSNRDAIGARVTLRINGQRQTREVDGGSGFLSRHSLPVYFGVGDAVTVDELRVDFPSGATVTLFDQPTNQLLVVTEE